MNKVKLAIDKIYEIGLPGKAINALGKIFFSEGGHVLVDNVTSLFVIRPRLAVKMVEVGLIELIQIKSLTFANLTSSGYDLAFELFIQEGKEDGQ